MEVCLIVIRAFLLSHKNDNIVDFVFLLAISDQDAARVRHLCLRETPGGQGIIFNLCPGHCVFTAARSNIMCFYIVCLSF